MSKNVDQLTEKSDREANDVFHIVRNGIDYKQKRSNILPLKSTYKALLTQSGTGAPTAVILENSIGAIVWTRVGAGTYAGTLSGAFPLSKTALSFGVSDSASGTPGIVVSRDTSTQPNAITVVSYDYATGNASDDILYSTLVLIEVYP